MRKRDYSGGTLQRLSTGTIHVAWTGKPLGRTMCGQRYSIGKRWIWSYNERATFECVPCRKTWEKQ